eukprot:scaffold6898_cov123-Cylindrotheca_fusiformis.AAC.4
MVFIANFNSIKECSTHSPTLQKSKSQSLHAMVGRYELSDLSSGSSDVESGFLLDEDVYCQQIGSQEGAATSSTPRRRAYVQSQYDRNTSNENGMLADHHHPYEKLYYRPILPKDRLRIQELHEEWFPVAYQEEFYDNLVHGKMFQTNDPLYTNLVCDEDDDIKACIVGMFVKGGILNHASRQLLLPDWPSRHDNVFYIMTLGTVPEFRHEGLATSLIAELEQIVKEDQGCGAMYLHVITSNKAAIRFYERLKFWRVQEIESKCWKAILFSSLSVDS